MAIGLALVLVPMPALAQNLGSLPRVNPVNPVAQARTGLYFQPYQNPSRGWRGTASMAYGSIIEFNRSSYGQYLLDGEVARVDFSLGRDIDTRHFFRFDAGLGSAAPGFMDGFFNWYHQLLGFRMPERELRPLDAFGYRLDLPDGASRVRSRGSYLDDLRISVGRRHNAAMQSVLTVTLPVGTGGPGYAKGTASFGLISTARKELSSRLVFEGSLGFGFTPRHGDLSAFQRQTFGAVTSGLRLRIWGHHSLYANLLYHSPYYRHTNFPALDLRELSLNYGWILRSGGGQEWTIGMTEDLSPTGPAIDAIFQISKSWDLH
jgi:hypothetical protein